MAGLVIKPYYEVSEVVKSRARRKFKRSARLQLSDYHSKNLHAVQKDMPSMGTIEIIKLFRKMIIVNQQQQQKSQTTKKKKNTTSKVQHLQLNSKVIANYHPLTNKRPECYLPQRNIKQIPFPPEQMVHKRNSKRWSFLNTITPR